MSRRAGNERRTIEELRTRYSLEPELADIYVEGSSDAALVRWFLGEHGRGFWQVYTIDSVDVPSELVLSKGLDVGARGRVLTLALTLGELLQHVGCVKPLFVADRDFDGLFGESRAPELCLLTDFTSMDVYGYDVRPLTKFLELVIQTRAVSAEEVLTRLNPTLVDLFLLRTVLHRRGSEIGLIADVTGCCVRHGNEIRIDLRELATRSINASAARSRPTVSAILTEVEELRSALSGDTRLTIHGHDFTRLLIWFLRPYIRVAALGEQEVARRALTGCLEVADLVQYRLFSELLRRTAV